MINNININEKTKQSMKIRDFSQKKVKNTLIIINKKQIMKKKNMENKK